MTPTQPELQPHTGNLERLEATARAAVADGQPRTITMYGAEVVVDIVATVDHCGYDYAIPRYRSDPRGEYIIRVMGGDAIIQRVIRDQHPDVSTWPTVL